MTLLVLALAATAAVEGAPPERKIRLVNPFPATGPSEIAGSTGANKVLRAMQNRAAPPVTDVLASHLRDALDDAPDRPVAIERRSRRGTLEGHDRVGRAVPDGRTLLLSSNAAFVIRAQVPEQGTHELLRQLSPVALVARMPMALVAARTHSVQMLLAQARAAPGRVLVGSAGDLTTAHLAAAAFTAATGTRLEHVAFNGAAAALRGVAAGQIEAGFVPLPAALPYVTNARIRILGIADLERHAAVSGVPTLHEQGVAGFEVQAWYGLFAPAATPGYVIADINARLATGLRSDRAARALAAHGLKVAHLGADALRLLIDAEIERWSPVIDALVRG